MSFLLDTMVVSEWMTPSPNMGVIRWQSEVDEDREYLSVVTLAELRYGAERLEHGARKTRFDTWLREELPQRFEGRLLAIDAAIANCWGRVTSSCTAAGRPIGVLDAFFVATAEIHGLTLITRNISDFAATGIPLFNPWT